MHSRFPDTIRSRLIALLLAASIPVVLLGGGIAWNNYTLLTEQSGEWTIVALEVAATRYRVGVETVGAVLGRVGADISATSGEPCTVSLQVALQLEGDRLAGITVLAASGAVRCAAGVPVGASAPPVQQTAWFATALRSSAPVPAIDAGTDASPFLVAVRLPDDSGVVVARLNGTQWLTGPADNDMAERASVWVVGMGGQVIPVTDGNAQAYPARADVVGRSSRTAAVPSASRDGRPHLYAALPLPDGARLLVGTSAVADTQRAQRALLRRLAELGVLLLAGLGALAVGAHLGVVAPLRRLADAVQRWRGGGAFDLGPLDGVPQEVRDVSLSFARATGALADRETQLRNAVAQQDLLMQEIHHRVKNNLQIVASLLNLQASRIRAPEAKAEFQSARDRIRALATLHRHLYAYGGIHTINMRSFLGELCDQLLQALGELDGSGTGGARVALVIEASELQISSDQAVPMALIVTEAVSNAAKYAFPDGRRGQIRVVLTVDGDSARLVIEDDGVGITAGRADPATVERDGIGMQLIRGFARQLGASLDVSHRNGTRYEMNMTLGPARAAESIGPPKELPTAG